MGRFHQLNRIAAFVKVLNLRLRKSWGRYAEFVHGEPKTSSIVKWTMSSNIPTGTTEFTIHDYAALYPHGFHFELRANEYELKQVFSRGEIFRPQQRCRVDSSLVQRTESKKVYHLPRVSAWLEALGFEEFDEEGLKAHRVSGPRGSVWVLLDPRPDVFARPLIEEIVRRREVQL